ncbi:MAG: type I restriction enzyme endonuclease domain-containing protein [Thermomicrobiales bacterium]
MRCVSVGTTRGESGRLAGAIAREVAQTVRNNATIDWRKREQVRARLRVAVSRVLRRLGYPPDQTETPCNSSANGRRRWQRKSSPHRACFQLEARSIVMSLPTTNGAALLPSCRPSAPAPVVRPRTTGPSSTPSSGV